jgi:hypothetical protein
MGLMPQGDCPFTQNLAHPPSDLCSPSSTIVTSNLDFPEWDQTFPCNRLLASASLDRLRHNAYCMVLYGVSYRAPRTTAGRVKSAPAKAAK